jgi:pyruvate/2-oxoacid:ferredoxin oxidoreductase alpha subunit/Pyruvate/2-oxoacid:ferredoxin oxidoreductase delta subunit
MSMENRRSHQQAWLKLTARISEGVSMADADFPVAERNMAGRSVAFSSSGNLAFCAGISASGLRASAWIGKNHLSEDLNTLRQMVRNQQPVVLVADTAQAKQLMDAGAFVLLASTVQELLDLTIIAHRVAENALVPGVVVFHADASEEEAAAALSPDHALLQFLGDADDRITIPTPAQQMLFGKFRRRIPRTFNTDIPVLIGAEKSEKGRSYEAAARKVFLASHLNEILEQAFSEFETVFGRNYQPFHAKDVERAEVILFHDEAHAHALTQTVKSKSRIGSILLKQLSPVPEKLKTQCEKATKLLVTERSAEGGALIFPKMCEAFSNQPKYIYSALYTETPTAEAVQSLVDKVETGKDISNPIWMDIPFTNENSAFPKKQVLQQQVRREYPHLNGVKKTSEANSVRFPERIPLVLRKYADHGPAYSRLADFFDNTAFFYDTDSSEWTADPLQSTPIMPSATAAFGRAAASRTQLPELDTANCTACGDCAVHCPHSAIPPLVLDIETHIRSGIKLAQANGAVITQLFPKVKNLAKAANKVVETISQSKEEQPLNLRNILTPAFDDFSKQAKFEGEQLEAATTELNAILDAVGTYSVVASQAHFNDASKELFSLAIDANACTGCGICSEVCADSALSMQAETDALKSDINRQFGLWEQFPDTHAETLQRLMDDADQPSLNALMLSRNFYMSLTGAGGSEGSSAKTMIHLVSAVAEAAIQPSYRALLQHIDSRVEATTSNLKKEMSAALPDIAANGSGLSLEKLTTAKVSLDEILGRQSEKSKLLDKAVLQRKLDLLKELGNLKDLITAGASGIGRSRYGIALDASLAELAQFPLNSFTVPVVCFDGASVEMAKGLVYGHIRHFLDNMKVLRRAELEESGKYNPALHDHQIAAIQWKDLSDEERSFAPALLLIVRNTLIENKGVHQMAQLLGEGFPVKIVIIDNANPKLENAAADRPSSAAVMLPFIAQQNIQVLQSSLANADHLFEGLTSAFGKSGGAVLRLLAPDNEHGNMQMLHTLATNSRAFTHLDHRPDRTGKLIFSKLHIDANVSSNEDWTSVKLSHKKQGEEVELPYEVTLADWAYTQADRKKQFSPWKEQLGEPTQVAAYLRLDDVKGKVPVIIRVNADQELVYHVVSEPIVRETAAALKAWNFLREVAGTLTEFPEKLRAKVEKELSVKYEQEKQKLTTEHDAKTAQLEQEYLEKIRVQIKSKLMQMAAER